MKKLIFTLAFIATTGLTTLSFAITPSTAITCQTEDKFVKIELSELPAAVATAVANEYKDATVKEAFCDKESALYKVVITISEGNEKTVIYNEKGEVQADAKAEETTTKEETTTQE